MLLGSRVEKSRLLGQIDILYLAVCEDAEPG